MTRDDLLSMLNAKAIAHRATGSRYICNPPPMDTDEDYIALDGGRLTGALLAAGFAQNTDPDLYEEAPDFLAFRLGEFNVIVTESAGFYQLFCDATEEAKRRNLLDKGERIALFQSILYGSQPDLSMDFDGAPL